MDQFQHFLYEHADAIVAMLLHPKISHNIYFIRISNQIKRYIHNINNLTKNKCPVIRTT